jgi:hypothetical protein
MPFRSVLKFVGKARSLPETGRFSLTGWKGLLGTYDLTYLAFSVNGEEKNFPTLTFGVIVLKLFSVAK